jgi:transcriptional regulator with XRE-family HTH domain
MNGVDQNINPMVRIDGVRVREIREQKGLTQLYLATAVEVTTDTISRWENKRYPSIKGENAEKLAEALEVDLEEILDKQDETVEGQAVDQPSPSSTAPVFPSRLKRHLSVIVMVLLMVVALQVARYFSQSSQPAIDVAATRTLPSHVPSGQVFPVLIRVDSSNEALFSLIVRETIPAGCQPVSAVPLVTSISKDARQIKWVSRLAGDSKVFAYLVRGPVKEENTSLVFVGQVLVGRQSSSPLDIQGDQSLAISGFHWADSNRDQRIDDEEILVVYDLFSDIEGFNFDRDLIDDIWASDGYRWERESGKYEILP